MSDIFQTLRSRGILEQSTCEQLVPGHYKVYSGFDPSADCLHLGNLMGLIVLRWFQLAGFTPVVILGGATGMIGDPSGRSKERNLLDQDTIQYNVTCIEKIVKKLLKAEKGLPEPVFLNNYDWFQNFKFIDFLRDAGKHFRLGTMLAKESVQSRLKSEEGLSFTEFCYQTLQAYDFFHLYSKDQVSIQCGGSDQWGNILAGCDLIARYESSARDCHQQDTELKISKLKPVGLVWPLLVRSDGKKFGKSEEGAIWLGSDKLSEYAFYQHLLKTPDSDVITFMKRLTFMPLDEIAEYEKQLQDQTAPANTAQKRYAQELTRFVHGEEGLQKALQATSIAKPGANVELNAQEFENLQSQIPIYEMSLEDILDTKVIDLLVITKLVESKAAAKRLIENRGVYLNQKVIENLQLTLDDKDIIDGQWLILSVGKKRRILVKIIK